MVLTVKLHKFIAAKLNTVKHAFIYKFNTRDNKSLAHLLHFLLGLHFHCTLFLLVRFLEILVLKYYPLFYLLYR